MFIKDNSVQEISPEEANVLSRIANKPIKELLIGNDNLIIYSNGQKDKIEDQSIFNLEANKLFTNNLVGFIGINDLRVDIGSRFSEDHGKQYFIQYMLQKINKLTLFDFNSSHDNTNIWEQILYLIFPIFLKKAYNQGVFKIYQKRYYNDSNVKGKIEITNHLKTNLPFIGNVAYSNRELCFNNPVTQLIRHTIEFISGKNGFSRILNSTNEVINAVRTFKSITPDYHIKDRQNLIFQNFNKVNHPFFDQYEPLRKLCIQILTNEGLSYRNSPNKVYGLLINASWLWEEYLYTILNDLDFYHPENILRKGSLTLFAECQELYPDFYNNVKRIVIDAKYKKMQYENKLSIDDIYQVVTYMYRLKAKYGVLLYPKVFCEGVNEYSSFKMHDDCYEGGESYFIKYGLNIPIESINYNQYVESFINPENELIKYVLEDIFKCNRILTP